MKKDEYLYKTNEFGNLKEIMYDVTEKNQELNAFIIKEKLGKEVKYKNISYKEALSDANNLGTALFDLGMKNKRIAIISKNRYEWIIGYFATLMGDMTVVPLDKGLTALELENSLSRSKADMVIFEKEYVDMVKNIKSNKNTNLKEYVCMDEVDGYKYIYDLIERGRHLLENGNDEYVNMEINPNDTRILLFTSGTTAASKIVMLAHSNVMHNVNSVNKIIKVYNKDIYLAMLPFHHCLGIVGFLIVFFNGGTSVFCDGLRYIKDNLKEYKVSIMITVPLLLEAMSKKVDAEIEKKGKTKAVSIAKKISKILLIFGIDIRRKLFKDIIDQFGGDIRYFISGAAALDKNVIKGFNEIGIRTIQGYGLTETTPVISIGNDKYTKDGSVGFPLKDVEVKIVDVDEEGIGEIVAKGPNIMLGYYENQEATDEVIKDGWFYTGDLGYIDEEGYVFITGRKKNVIVLKNGKNIYPEELENLVNKLDVVKESMVFGLPKGDDLVVSVKVQYDEEVTSDKYKGMNEEGLREIIWEQIKEINKMLPKYKYIKNMILTNEDFIKTTTNKIKRHEEMKKMEISLK